MKPLQRNESSSPPPKKEDQGRQQVADKRHPTEIEGDAIHVTPLERQPFFIVCLGASAGGLETLEQFFTNMAPDSGMAFVVVVHLDPTHKTLLPELLARYTRMEVCTAEEGMTVEPNVVYVIPANRDMSISGGQLRLEEPQAPRGMRHTIDVFLRSLAADMEENAIAVILSGTGTDGTQGVKAVKEAGGIVVVQDEASAKYPGMPQSAIATGVSDLVLPTHRMPEKIMEIALRSTLLVQRKETEPAKQMAEQLKAIFSIVNACTGNDFSSYKISTIMRRIERRMAVNDIIDIDDYIRFLEKTPDESKALFKEFLIGVTSFFRDPEAFGALEQQVIPRLFEGHDTDDPLRIWMAGCATGEEAYSVAILLREYSREHRLDHKVQIFATDIDGEAIDFGRAGLYPDSIAADVSPGRLRAFFKKTDSTYQVVKSLREMIVFAQHNIIKDPPFSRLDLLVCRNLLIYLGPTLQKRILPLFAQSLKLNGFMFLGTSETVGGFTDLFLPLDKKWKIFQRRETGHRLGVEFPISPVKSPIPEGRPVRAYQEEGISPGVLAEKTLIQRYSPPCVVINEKFEVVYFSTRTSRYLEPPVGEPTQNILKMARNDLRPALRAAVHKAVTEQEAAVYRGLKLTTETSEETLDLRVEPVTTPPSAKGLVIVIFEPTGTLQPVPPQRVGQKEPAREDDASHDLMVRQLEEQLRITNEELQSTVERMETANEELKSSNEELMSMNEEYQSTNEELETSKEELQALNEELVTVNSELQNKVDELDTTNSDLQNFLASTDIATIFLDRQLRVKRFSPAMAKLFTLYPTDIGRPFQHFSGTLNYPELQDDAENVLEKLSPSEREVGDPQHCHHYLARVRPYRTMEDVIDGVVVTFIDITDRQRMEERTVHLASFPRINPNPVLEADLDGTIVYFNPAIGELLRSVGLNDQDASPFLPEDLPDVLKDWDRSTESVHHREVAVGEMTFAATVHLVPEMEMVRIYAYDVTARKSADAALRESENFVRAILNTVDEGFIVIDRDYRIITANRCFCDQVGISSEEVIGRKCYEVTHKFDKPCFEQDEKCAPYEVFRTGTPATYNHVHHHDDGDVLFVETRAYPLKNEGGRVVSVIEVIRNITEKHLLEEERLKAQKLESIGTLAGGIAHDFNNLLQGVFGNIRLAKETRDQKDQSLALLGEAEDALRQATNLTNQLLTFAKGGKPIKQRISLLPAIENAVKFALSGSNTDYRLTHTDAPWPLDADEGQIMQAFQNIVINAREAMSEGGSVAITIENLLLARDDIAELPTGGRFLKVTFRDTGSGIPEHHLSRIFDPYFSTKQRGSGLGLATVYSIIKNHGGISQVQSEVDVGTTFTLYLPAAEGEVLEPAASGTATEGEKKARVLLMDDDERMRKVGTRMLERIGHKVICAVDGRTAIEQYVSASEAGTPFDIVILDLTVKGGMGGEETIGTLLEIDPNVVAVVSSGYADNDVLANFRSYGFSATLNKPYMLDELKSCLQALL
jgi:two-component system CheB/CheR fusion protein